MNNDNQSAYASYLLSSMGLPNVLIKKNIHTTPSQYKLDEFSLNNYVAKCIARGFLHFEYSSAILTKSRTSALHSPCVFNKASLHPFTVLLIVIKI